MPWGIKKRCFYRHFGCCCERTQQECSHLDLCHVCIFAIKEYILRSFKMTWNKTGKKKYEDTFIAHRRYLHCPSKVSSLTFEDTFIICCTFIPRLVPLCARVKGFRESSAGSWLYRRVVRAGLPVVRACTFSCTCPVRSRTLRGQRVSVTV